MATPGRRHIAIVGISAQLPSGVHSQENLNPRTFWKFLLDRLDAFESIPQDRLDQISPSGSVPSPVGTFLKDPTKFDNVEFGIATKDALSMTASTRRLIESTFLASLDSGIDSRGKRIGVFNCGTNLEGFELDGVGSRGLGTTANTLANRPAFVLDFTGPSVYVDTACSSTLTAMHLAIRSIESGDCDAAVVGGCQYNMNLWDWWSYSNGGVLSTEGKSQPFDVHADGLLKGEGSVSMVIKPLDVALVDHDHVYAVILGTSINSSGSGASLHAPSATAQQQCIRDAFASANRDPNEVDFVELHATGTAVGDPIEANVAGESFARPADVVVGSVKGNLGHLESTAYLASLLKVCLMLEHKIIPPNANVNISNPNIAWEKYRMKVPSQPMPLRCLSKTGRSLIALSSSGIGGSNGHMVVEGPPNVPPPASLISRAKSVLFIVGGLSPRATQEIYSSVVNLLNKDSSKEALSQAVTQSRRARQLPWRTYFVYTPGVPLAVRIEPVLIPRKRPPIVFVFTGQGPQHINMGRDLFAASNVFRESILEMDKIYENFTGASLIKTTGLFDGENTTLLPPIWSVDITSPAMAIIEIALFDLLVSVGVRPDVLVGHSMGETPLLYASGACSKAMAVEVAIARGIAMKVTEIGAGMAAVSCGAGRAALLIEQTKSELDGVLEIACLNTPDATVLSGSDHLVEKVVALAQQDEIFASKLKSVTPGHTSIMENCRLEYECRLAEIFSRNPGSHKPVLPTYTSVGGHHGKLIEEFTPQYLWNNVRKYVAFHQAIDAILQDSPSSLFVEISPHPALSAYISTLTPTSVVTCPMRRLSKKTTTESIAFAETLGVLATNGINSIDLTTLYGRASRDPAFNIDYPFTARHFPLRIDGPRERTGLGVGGPCSQRLTMNAKTHPDLAEHVINGEPIAPATAFIDMILQVGAKFLWNLDFRSVLSLASETPVEVRVEHEGCNWTIKSLRSTSRAKTTMDERIHATGLSSQNIDGPIPNLNIEAIFKRLPNLNINGFYERLKPIMDFGPEFRRLRRLSGNENEALAEVVTFAKDARSNSYCFHPVTLDACLHYALHPEIMYSAPSGTTYLPRRLRKFAFYQAPKPGEPVYSYFVLQRWSPEIRWADITVCNKTGSVLCKLEGLELHKVSSSCYVVKDRFDLLLQPVMIDAAIPQYDRVWRREDQEEIDALSIVMDHLSADIIKRSLEGGLVVGEEVHRQRYYAFAKSVTARALAPLPPASVVEQLRSKFAVFFDVMSRLAPVHKDVFKSPTPAVQALFSDDIMDKFYSSGYFSPIHELAVDVFQKTISAIARRGKHVIRVLEVGAGTGGLARHLCNSLQRRADNIIVQYVVSDASFDRANSVAKSTMYKYASPKTYRLSEPPEPQGLTPGSFDIVVGLYALHNTQHISSTLSFVRQLLVSGGSLLAVDLDKCAWQNLAPGCVWHDFLFGSLEEWFDFMDRRGHCSLTTEDWTSLLLSSGYETVQMSTSGNNAEFLFTAQKIGCPSSPRLDLPSPFFLTYKHGHEMELQREIRRLDVNQHLFLWLLASDGVDGTAGMGLVQCLVLEFSAWNIHLAIFEGTQDETDRIDLVLRYQEYLDNDTAVRFSVNGLPHVLKVVPSPPPVPNRVDWMDTSTDQHLLPLQEDHVAVDVLNWSGTFSSWRGFVGHINQTNDEGFSTGDLVLGVVADAPASNRIVCHSGQLTSIPSGVKTEGLAEYALTMVITAIVLGPSRTFCAGARRKPARVLLAAQDELAQTLHGFLKLFQSLAHVEIDRAASDAQFDWIVVDSGTAVQRPEVAFWRGNLLIWDKVMREMAQADPGSLGCSLQIVLQLAAPLQSSMQPRMIQPDDQALIPPTTEASSTLAEYVLFDRNKSYILIGGVSDFGIHIALWMYEHGARYIVLTSRRGRKFFEESSATATRQILSYMESREDLVLRVEACNATSLKATSNLIRMLGKPLGGCFSMTLVLSDALFLNQTEESFRISCNAKLDVLRVFEAATSIEKLDFFVHFSSIAPLFGNHGQSNYSMANSLTDYYLEKYHNAFSLIIPAIREVGSYARMRQGAARKETTPLSISLEEFFAHLEDGLLKLSQGSKCTRYIFDMPWDAIDCEIGLPKSAQHLASFEDQDSTGSNKSQDKSTIINTVLNLLDVSLSDFSADVPIVSYGLDSLSATRMSEAIRPYANVSQMQLLAGITWKQIEDRFKAEEHGTATKEAQSPGSTEEMLQMVDKYCKDFRVHRPSKPTPIDEVVLVTGTTGAIGASVLSELVQSTTVRLVYAVNRRAADGSSLTERQKHALAIRGLDPTIADSPKVVLIEADLDLPDLGLTLVLLEQMLSSITHIIHISWMVNWMYGLDAYEPNIRATRHLIDLALSSPLPTPPRILFTSSIGVLAPDQNVTAASPERYLEPNVGFGYSEAKWVAERLFELAASTTPLRPIVVRITQIAGGINGYWKPDEWMPSIVESAMVVKCLPAVESSVSWVPLDIAAKILVGMRNSSKPLLHLAHPRPTPWNTVFERIASILNVDLVSYSDWLARLESARHEFEQGVTIKPGTRGNAERLTAFHLIDNFYRVAHIHSDPEAEALLPKMSTEIAEKVAPSLANIRQLSNEDVDKWMTYWRSVGRISF